MWYYVYHKVTHDAYKRIYVQQWSDPILFINSSIISLKQKIADIRLVVSEKHGQKLMLWRVIYVACMYARKWYMHVELTTS